MQNGHGLTRPPGTGSLTPPAPLVPLRKRIHRLGHLAARYTDAVLSRRLTPAEQAEAAGYLRSDAERGMFWGQSKADRRHGLAAARSIAEARPDRPDLIRAALLHDVGKRHARLGAAGRVWAVVRSGLGFPPSERGRPTWITGAGRPRSWPPGAPNPWWSPMRCITTEGGPRRSPRRTGRCCKRRTGPACPDTGPTGGGGKDRDRTVPLPTMAPVRRTRRENDL